MLARPREAYFHSPELGVYFMGNESVLFVERILPPGPQEELDKLIGAIGVASEPRRIRFEPDLSWEERARLRGRTGITAWRGEDVKDYDLDGLDLFLDRLPTLGKEQATGHSLILWRFLSAHQSEYGWFYGNYSWFHYNPWSADFPARFLKQLRESAWLPGQDGTLRRPAELSLDDLPEEFERNRQLADHLEMKSEQLAEMAAQLGVDEEAVLLLREHPEELKEFVKGLQRAKDVAGARGATVTAQSDAQARNSDAEDVPSGEDQPVGTDTEHAAQTDSRESSERGKHLPVIVATGTAASSGRGPGSGPDMEVARAGARKAMQYEIDHGREPQEMPHSNEGFDIRAWDPVKKVTRLIEVKSLSGEWGEANVALSAPQLRFGMKEEPGHEYWLYVVEWAGQEDAQIYCIPDPARKASAFIYPSGWRKLAVREPGAGES